MIIKHGKRSGVVDIPSSKSISHRIIIASLLSGVEVKDELVRGWSDDLKATRDCLRAILGGKEHEWHCKESGTTLRLLEPIAGVLGASGNFICEGRLGSRPRMDRLANEKNKSHEYEWKVKPMSVNSDKSTYAEARLMRV